MSPETPIPRFDLPKPAHYDFYGVQFTRGCPFTCEFCDIIHSTAVCREFKSMEQMLAELEALTAWDIAAPSTSSTTTSSATRRP